MRNLVHNCPKWHNGNPKARWQQARIPRHPQNTVHIPASFHLVSAATTTASGLFKDPRIQPPYVLLLYLREHCKEGEREDLAMKCRPGAWIQKNSRKRGEIPTATRIPLKN